MTYPPLNQQTILVTGGAGFIGHHVCQKLLELGAKVISLDNFDPFYPKAIKENNLKRVTEKYPHFKNLNVDITDAKALNDSLSPYTSQITQVVHLAAKAGVRPSMENPTGYLETNVTGTLNILEWMVNAKITKLVFASSSSVYGSRNNAPFLEAEDISKPISPYAATKVMGENLIYTYTHLHNLQAVCLRFFTVYGPSQRPDLAIHKFSKLIYNNQPIIVYGDGSAQRDFTYVDDIVEGIMGACQYSATPFEAINLGESKTTSVLELIQALESHLNLKANIKFEPSHPGDVPLTCASIEKAKALLNYQPKIGPDIGLKQFCDWFLSVNLR
jgi:UDP-glucuronate 4-epimerase